MFKITFFALYLGFLFLLGRRTPNLRKNYKKLGHVIVEHIGGMGNIISMNHCVTRLRFRLKDESKADTTYLKANKHIISLIRSGGQFQMVIGNDVSNLYDAINETYQVQVDDSEESDHSNQTVLDRFIDLLSNLFQPFLGALGATGIIKGLVSIMSAMGITADNGVYMVLEFVGDGFFQFLPFALAVTASRHFKISTFLGIAVAGAFLHPNISEIVGGSPMYLIFEGTVFESEVFGTFLGMPIIFPPTGNYYSSVIPIILAVWFAAKVYHTVNRHVPTSIAGSLTPLLTLFIATPIAILFIGPASTWLSDLVGWLFAGLYALNPTIFGIVLTSLWQVLVIFGLHWGIVPLGILQFTLSGSSVILALTKLSTFSILGMLVAIGIHSKQKKVKERALSAALPAFFGITEPAIYGIMLPLRKLFIVAILINAIVGAYFGYFGVTQHSVGGLGVFSIPTFVDPIEGLNANFWYSLIGYGLATLLGFLAVMAMGVPKLEVDEEPEQEQNTEITREKEVVVSPLVGEVIELSNIPDDIYSSGAMGSGVAILPRHGRVVAPINGVVSTIFRTGHALNITSEHGTTILIHIGINTIHLEGRGFTKHVSVGDEVKVGQLLVEVDLDILEAEGFSTVTPIIVTNTSELIDMQITEAQDISETDYLFTTIK